MGVTKGYLAKFVLNGVTIAEIGSYTISGISVDSIEITAFGDEAKDYIPGLVDPGDFTVTGHYDRTNTTGQIVLEAAVAAATEYAAGTVRFYIDSNTYLTPAAGGIIFFTKSKNIGMDKAGVGTIEFAGKISAACLEQLSE